MPRVHTSNGEDPSDGPAYALAHLEGVAVCAEKAHILEVTDGTYNYETDISLMNTII